MRDTHRAVLYNSLGRQALKPSGRRSRSRTQPLAPRVESPSGAINPRARKGESTFGNTVSTGFSQKPTASGAAAVRRHKKWRRKAPTSPAERYYITPEGGARRTRPEGGADPGQNPGSPGAKAPAAASTLGPKGRQPSGIQSSADSSSKAPRLKYRTQQKSTNDFSLVLLS